MLAKQLDTMNGEINNFKNLLQLLMYVAIPMLLIYEQPDMGMTMVNFFIVLGIFFCMKLYWKTIFGGLSSILVLLVVIWNSSIIQDYQKVRLTSFLHPTLNLSSSGLQLLQSKIGIGSGGILGKGFLKGTQFQNIPENYNDFIFSVLGEEWGLIGAIIIYRLIKIAKNSKDIFGTVISVGLISNLLFSIFQNIGMTIGIMPITGITLPFMSAGGSSIITSFMLLGLVLNIGMRRKKINF